MAILSLIHSLMYQKCNQFFFLCRGGTFSLALKEIQELEVIFKIKLKYSHMWLQRPLQPIEIIGSQKTSKT